LSSVNILKANIKPTIKIKNHRNKLFIFFLPAYRQAGKPKGQLCGSKLTLVNLTEVAPWVLQY